MEVDEIDLGFVLIHVLIVVLPCGFSYVLGVYTLEKQDTQITSDWIGSRIHGTILKFVHSIWTCDMAKSIISLEY